MAHTPLSEGFFERVARSDGGQTDEQPVLQVIGTRPLNNGERYRLLVSDGLYCNPWVMLATQLNELVINKAIHRFCVIKVRKHICNVMNASKNSDSSSRKILILLEVDVLHEGESIGQIGNPTQLNQDGSVSAPASSETTATTPAPKPTTNGVSGVKRPLSSPNVAEQPKPKTKSHVAASNDLSKETIAPISFLSPYQNNWVLRARVTQKSDIRTYSNSRGEGKLFSMTIADESGEIRVTFFNEGVDKNFDNLEVGRVYYIKGGRLKAANKQYSSVKHEYEITGGNETQIIPCDEDTKDIPRTSFNFVRIKQIADTNADAIIDVIGVVKSVGDATTFTAKSSQREFTKRELVLVDESRAEINLTLWGDTAVKFEHADNPVIAIKGVKVSGFGGKSLSTTQSSSIFTNPVDVPEAHKLRGWFDNGGRTEVVEALTTQGGSSGGHVSGDLGSVALAKLPIPGTDARYDAVLACPVSFREANAVYKSCSNKDCKRKVQDANDGTYLCPKCNIPNNTEFTYRYMLNANVRDATDGVWVTFFDEQAKQILGADAQVVGQAFSDEEESTAHRIFQEALFQPHLFKLRGKMETYNDDNRLKTTCVTVQKLSTDEQINFLEKEIARLCNKLNVTPDS
ncbi:unnamed protein product, partial [Notodromas monacha]